jgi:hypothetical protein
VWLWDTAAQCPLAMACLNINASCREILYIYHRSVSANHGCGS